MDSVEVGLLRARYHGDIASSERSGLDNVVREGVIAWLPAALEAAGVGECEDVCIRRLSVRTQLPRVRTTAGVTRSWCAAVGAAVEDLLGSGGDDVVRYPSRVHTLVDLVVSSTRRAPKRAWAWRDLGLWPEGAAGPAAASRALLSDPTTIVPVMAALARSPDDFARFCTALDPSELDLLARMAAVAGGAALESGFADGVAVSASDDVPAVRPEWVAARSAVLRAAPAVVAERPRSAFALAVLALLEAEPTSLRRAGASATEVAGSLARLVRLRSGEGSVDARREAGRAPEGDPTPGPQAHAGRRNGEGLRTEGGAPSAPPPASVAAARSSEASVPAARLDARASGGRAGGRPIVDGGPVGDGEEADAAASPLADMLRKVADTEHGGLLLLLNVLEDDGIADSLLDAPELARRTGRALLHALARRLSDAGETDAAALAFCGLRPGDAPPDDDPLDPVEQVALEHARLATLEAVGRRLGLDRAATPPEMHELIGRRAHILADPGWIEVRFSFDEMSVAVRRSGMDRDPGFLPWLGAVVRFRYA